MRSFQRSYTKWFQSVLADRHWYQEYQGYLSLVGFSKCDELKLSCSVFPDDHRLVSRGNIKERDECR